MQTADDPHHPAAHLAFALAATAAGCGGGDDDESGGATTGTTEQVSGSVSVMGIWVGEEQQSFQAVVDGFKEQQPDVDVKYNPVGDNLPTVLSTAVQGGNPPDVAAIAQPGLLQQFAEQGELKPLDFVERHGVANFGQDVVDIGTVNETFYGLLWKAEQRVDGLVQRQGVRGRRRRGAGRPSTS